MLGIVTISYNQAAYLDEALRSVEAARGACAMKYVVVDPGSTDGSRELIDKYKTAIDVAVLEPDAGPGDGLNKGFAACRDCEVLGYLNADDRFVPGALAWVTNYFAQARDVDVLLGAVAIIDGTGKRSRRGRVSDRFDLRRYAIGACNAFQQGTFFRRSAFARTSGFNTANRTCWDAELLVDMAIAGARFRNTNKLLGEFRIHDGSISGSGRMFQRYVADRERIAAKIRDAGVPSYPEWQSRIVRTLHRFNPIRHAAYLLAS